MYQDLAITYLAVVWRRLFAPPLECTGAAAKTVGRACVSQEN
jgi:hypothetical protein